MSCLFSYRLFFIFIFVFTVFSNSCYAVKNLFGYKKGKRFTVKVVKHNKMTVNETCLKKKSCKALSVLRQNIFYPKIHKRVVGHPANSFCLRVGGHPYILKDSKKHEYNFCFFDDLTAIDSWDLHKNYKRVGKK